MKRLFFILTLFAFFGITNGQDLVRNTGVQTYEYGDTLVKDSTYNNVYYVSTFVDNLRLQMESDTLKTGYIKVNAIVSGSLDYSNWYNIDTLSVAGSGASANGTLLTSNVFYNYIKVTVKAIDSTQYVTSKYYLLIDKE